MRGAIRKKYHYGKRVRLETIHEDEEFRDGPYPSGVQLVLEWVGQLFSCWFDGHMGVCVRGV